MNIQYIVKKAKKNYFYEMEVKDEDEVRRKLRERKQKIAGKGILGIYEKI